MTKILIDDVTIVDGLGNEPEAGRAVLIDGDRITTIAAAGSIADPEADRIDGSGKVLMPGMIDCHCHISFGEARLQEEQDLYTSVESRTLRSAWNLKKVLRAGVTGFSAPGGSYFIGVALRNAVAAGMVQGPRLTTAGRFITTSNGISDFYPTSVGVPEGSIGIVANTLDEMRTEVRHQVKNGVDLIKIGDSSTGEYTAFRREEIAGMVEMAHQLQKHVTIHARGSEAVDFAVSAGVDWIMHGDRMTDDVIERLAESGIPLCPTLTLIANLADWGHLVGVPQRKRDAYKRLLFEYAGPALTKAHQAGVPFMTGTDTGFAVTPFGEWHARELELLMTHAGLTSLEAIKAATSNSALALGLDGEAGIVGEGKIADLLLVDGDPVSDVRVLQDRDRLTVISGGVVQNFDDDDVDQRWPYDRAQVIAIGEITREAVRQGEAAGHIEQSSGRWSTV
jgi:imidazolonepropionase-like amidohydrolase